MRILHAFSLLILAPASLTAQSADNNFAAVDWHPKPAALRSQCDAALKRTREQIASALVRPLQSRTLENSLKVVEAAVTNLAQETSPLTFLYEVAPDSAVRAASVDCDQKTANFFVDLGSNPDVYATAQALTAFNSVASPDDRKLIALYIESGAHAGAALDSATRHHTSVLFKKLNDLQRDFGIALATDTTTIETSTEGIAGLPPQFVATLKRTTNGTYVIPVNESTFWLVLRNATGNATRERFYRAQQQIGGAANVDRLSHALILRDSIARLMGIRNWASFQLQTKMAKTPERVLAFLKDVDAKLLPKARAEQAERAALKMASGDTTPYRPWDYFFYANLVSKQKYAVDEQEIRQYFPVDRVVSGVLNIYSHLLGVRFVEVVPANAWASNVREFSVTDSLSGKALGVIFLDLFPRPNKYNHFANWGLRSSIVRPDGKNDQTIGAIVGNWPTPEPGKPALLSHGDVITFFHEFGHLMDGTLATSPYVTNLNLRQDFVEAPSQMLENWMWQPEVLRSVSRNVTTGVPLPDSLIAKMIAAKHVGEADKWTYQVFFSMYDMTLASLPPTIDLTQTWNDLLPRLTAAEATTGGFPEASFGHLMGGYDAGYYGYLWSRVYAQDMFTRFEKEGVLNPATGLAYRRIVLEPGGLREPDELLREFLGRPLSYEAFYRDVGIHQP